LASEAQKIQYSTQNLEVSVPQMVQYRISNWAIGLAQLSKKLPIIPIKHIKYSKQLEILLVVELEEIVLD
jgi:hypothetical protein